jgi:hypothetical protein
MIKTQIEDLNKTKNKACKWKKNRFEVGKRRSLKGIIIKENANERKKLEVVYLWTIKFFNVCEWVFF